MKIHHIGYLVKNINKSITSFTLLGYELESGPVYDEIRKIDIAFLTKEDYRVELVASAAEDSTVAELAKKYENMPYHISYESDDFEKDVDELSKNGFIPIDKATPAPAIEGKEVEFFINANMGMIEVIKNN